MAPPIVFHVASRLAFDELSSRMRPANVLKALQRVTSSGEFIQEVDQLRFFAIFTVLYCHIASVFQGVYHALPSAIYVFLENGANGVRLFFAISGFVLFLPFFKAPSISKPFSVRRFYTRRLTRLEPTFVVAITFYYLMKTWVLRETVGVFHLLATITYSHQLFYGVASTLLPATWSLEVEFQFYLIVPIFAHIARVPKTRRRLILVAFCLLSVLANRLLDFSTRSLATESHYFIIGILAVDLYVNELMRPESSFGRFVSRWPAVICIPFLFGIMRLDARHGSVAEICAFLLATLGFMLAVLRNARLTASKPLGPVAVFGGMCYTIYLYHSALIYTARRITAHYAGMSMPPGFAVYSLLAFALVCLCCPFLFLAFEKPFMRRRPFRRMAERWMPKAAGA
jgi:peptidoglycan/LPS O-acetylase OafA/YrhL